MEKIAYVTVLACLVAMSGLMTGCESTPIEALGGADIGVPRHNVVGVFRGDPDFEVTADYAGPRRDETYIHKSGQFELHIYGGAASLTKLVMVVRTSGNNPEVTISLPRSLFPELSSLPDTVYETYSEVAFGPVNTTRKLALEQRQYVFTKDGSGTVTMTVTRVHQAF